MASKEIIEEIVELYNKGLTIREISIEIGLKKEYVYNILKDYLKRKEDK